MSDDAHVLDDGDEPLKDSDSSVIYDAGTPGGEPIENNESILKVYAAGELTVVGFGGQDVPDEACIAAYREQLEQLIDENDCKRMACDLSGVRFVPSGMLGVLLSLKKKGVEIELYNPSEDVMEVLRITKLEQLFEIKEVDLGGLV